MQMGALRFPEKHTIFRAETGWPVFFSRRLRSGKIKSAAHADEFDFNRVRFLNPNTSA